MLLCPVDRIIRHPCHTSAKLTVKAEPAGTESAGDLSPESVLSMFLNGPVEGCDAAALADLLLATIQRMPDPAGCFGAIAVDLAGAAALKAPSSCPPLSHQGTNGYANGSDAGEQESPAANGSQGNRLAHLGRLLVQLTKLLERSEHSPEAWRSPQLDSLAVALAQHDQLIASGYTWQVGPNAHDMGVLRDSHGNFLGEAASQEHGRLRCKH
jgi:hypothetical protein